jgi:tetratricopeptide (TPR) repeat protein
MYRPPYESTLNIEPRAKQWYHYAWSLKEYKYTANNLGYIYEDLKEYDKAKQWYEKAVERVNQVCLT